MFKKDFIESNLILEESKSTLYNNSTQLSLFNE